jgi:hypothetical protein
MGEIGWNSTWIHGIIKHGVLGSDYRCNPIIGFQPSKHDYSQFTWFMVFNVTFNYISIVSWRSVLLAEEQEYTDLSQVIDKHYLRIECILLKIHWGMKALTDVHFHWSALWILFVLDYLLLEITTPLIVYIWRRHGGTCKFGFEFHWDVKLLFYNHVTTS